MAVKQSRPFDALFDTTYTVSGARDHYKQQGQAGFVLQKVPEHDNFFSDLQHHPASTFRIKASQQLPACVDRSFHPHERVPQLLKWQSTRGQISGPHMFKFFRRPLLPAGASLTLPLRLAPQQPVQQAPPPPPEPASKDAGTQSDYRESEAQTLPWSPDWVLPTNPAVLAKQAALCAKFNIAGPEVLQLAHLTFGNGLPGGLQEVRRLEKLRAKRAFEASLPPIDDVARLPERQAMIEAWEAQEWVEREEEIKGVQEERLELLAQALQVREEEIEAAHREQVQRRSAGLLASKANKFAAIHTERLKTFRQLAAAKDKVTGTLDRKAKSSIIQQYADYGSALYAPPQREGHFPDVIPAGAATAGQRTHTAGGSTAQQLHPAMFAPSTIAGLTELEASLPKKVLRAPQQKPATQQHTLTYKQRTEAAVQQDVETIHDMLQAAKAATGTRGIGKVWPCPLDDGPASAAVLAAAAAAATEGHGSSRHGLRSAGGKSSAGGSLAVAAAAAAAATAGASGRPVFSAKSAAAKAGASAAAASQGVTEAPPLPDPEGKHAALVLLQRLLRGRAVQNQMYAGKESRLLLIRELRLGLEGTGGCQPRPEVRDAGTQERDAAPGAALCRLCCLLASDDQEAIAQVLLAVAEGRRKQEEQQQLCQQQPMQQAVQEQEQDQQQVGQQEPQSVDEQQQQQQEEEEQVQQQELQQDSPEQASDVAQRSEQDIKAAELLLAQQEQKQQQKGDEHEEEQQQQDEQQQQRDEQRHEEEAEQEAGQGPAQLSDPQSQPADVEAAMQLNASAGELSTVSTTDSGGVGSGTPADAALPTAALSASDDPVEDAAAGAPAVADADVADEVDAAVVE